MKRVRCLVLISFGFLMMGSAFSQNEKVTIEGRLFLNDVGLNTNNDTVLVLEQNGEVKKKFLADQDPLNEVQAISMSNDTIFLENGGFVKLPQDMDKDSTNELQTITYSYTGDTMFLSNGSFLIVPGISNANNPRDADGNVYTPVRVGNQTWLKENSRAQSYNDGTPIGVVTNSFAWVDSFTIGRPVATWYNFDSLNYDERYGMYYHANTFDTTLNVCPLGYRLPDSTEIADLIAFNGGQYVAGEKLKEVGTENWDPPNSKALDTYGFRARAAGIFSQGSFFWRGAYAFWWTQNKKLWEIDVYDNVLYDAYNPSNTILVYCCRIKSC